MHDASDKDQPKSDEPSEPVPASTVVLMRPADNAPFEVFLVKRHEKSAFMANAFVYPGGKLDPEDLSDNLALHGRGYLPQDLAERLGVDEKEALGLHMAALRELFEEAGALFATEGNDDPIDLEDPVERDRYETYREMLQEGELDFNQVVGWEDLCLRIDELTYFAHWITPEVEPRRFDTRFFMARAPERQDLIHDKRETVASMWASPAEVVARYELGEFELAPPTLCTLEALSHFASIDEAIAYFEKAAIPTILPHAMLDEGQVTLLLPGDPAYPHAFDTPVAGATRILLKDGRWVPTSAPKPGGAADS